MSVLTDVQPMQWLLLALALAAYTGPGLALLAWALQVGRRLDFTQEVACGFALSLSLWTVLFALLSLFGVALPGWAGWLAALGGWGAYAVSRRRRLAPAQPPLLQESHWFATCLLWGVVAVTAAAGLWALRAVVAQPGSDGYHHTLIAQLIAQGGGLPDGMTPLTSLVTFTYHFGYHGLAAVLQWMTGISAVALAPILGQLLKAAAALAVALLAEAIGERRSGGIVAAAVAGLVSVFPAYYVNWGRNPQVAGLVILCVLLSLVWLWGHARPAWSTAGLLALLAAGLALTHYRVTLMAALGCLLLVAACAWQQRWGWNEWRSRLLHGAVMVVGALLLVMPWLWHVRNNQDAGYSAAVSTPEATFFELDRLGGLVLGYATNSPLLLLLGLALAWGLWQRMIGVWVMACWALLLYALSQPWAANQYMDTITVVLSLFVPGAVVIGLAAAQFWQMEGRGRRWRRPLLAGVTVGLSLFGSVQIGRIVDPGAMYVWPQDLAAAQWAGEQTPPDALFMVNTFAFDFVPEYVIGSDAGGWLPVLAGRHVVTAPMTFPIERSEIEDYPQQIRRLASFSHDLASPDAVRQLRQWGVTHVYIGQRGGPIDVAPLLSSPLYEVVYHEGSVYIFRLSEEG